MPWPNCHPRVAVSCRVARPRCKRSGQRRWGCSACAVAVGGCAGRGTRTRPALPEHSHEPMRHDRAVVGLTDMRDVGACAGAGEDAPEPGRQRLAMGLRTGPQSPWPDPAPRPHPRSGAAARPPGLRARAAPPWETASGLPPEGRGRSRARDAVRGRARAVVRGRACAPWGALPPTRRRAAPAQRPPRPRAAKGSAGPTPSSRTAAGGAAHPPRGAAPALVRRAAERPSGPRADAARTRTPGRRPPCRRGRGRPPGQAHARPGCRQGPRSRPLAGTVRRRAYAPPGAAPVPTGRGYAPPRRRVRRAAGLRRGCCTRPPWSRAADPRSRRQGHRGCWIVSALAPLSPAPALRSGCGLTGRCRTG
jgi:hypothetical protein